MTTKLKRYTKKDFADAGEELDVKAREYAEKNELTYSEAVVHFLSTDSDLANRYEADRDRPVEKDYSDPWTPDEKDSRYKREYKKYRKAEEALDTQAKILMLKYNLPYSEAFKTVLQMPSNREAAHLYIRG